MKIPLVDLKAQYLSIQKEINEAIQKVVDETAFIGGRYLTDFESNFANYCGTKHAVGVSNGTDALRLALLACNVGPGDEVITVPNTFIATVEAIRMCGASVRFVDVDPDTYNMNPALLKAALTPKTKAIMPVHLYGRPADMDPILKFAAEHNLKVIGDAAQAHGAIYHGKKIGTLGDVVSFSFYPGKNLGAFGDAGAIVTNNPTIAEKVSLLRDHGRKKKYEHEIEGFNCRLDTLQAAILNVKLKYLEKWTEQRIHWAQSYQKALKGLAGIELPKIDTNLRSVFHLYVIRVSQRQALQDQLQAKGIATGIHYPIPLHQQPALSYLGYKKGSFPVSERASEEILSLPMYPELTQEQFGYITDSIQSFAHAAV